MPFELHPSLAKKAFIMELPLCHVLLENNQHYPWIFLVPKRENVVKIMDLVWEDQVQLLREVDAAQKVMQELFNPSRLNVAAIGNKTPQLHVHVMARFEGDPAWPGVVWGHSEKKPYEEEAKTKIIQQIKEALEKKLS